MEDRLAFEYLIFTPSDFDDSEMPKYATDVAAVRANSILNAWLGRRLLVYGNPRSALSVWTVERTQADTHRAILCFIEKIEPVKHDCSPSASRVDDKPWEYLKDKDGYFVCSMCSKRLKPVTWSPV